MRPATGAQMEVCARVEVCAQMEVCAGWGCAPVPPGSAPGVRVEVSGWRCPGGGVRVEVCARFHLEALPVSGWRCAPGWRCARVEVRAYGWIVTIDHL